MAKHNNKDKQESNEMIQLNKELMSLDFDDVSAEELERRLELAIAAIPFDDEATCSGTNTCSSFSGSGDCSGTNGCGAFASE